MILNLWAPLFLDHNLAMSLFDVVWQVEIRDITYRTSFWERGEDLFYVLIVMSKHSFFTTS